jgi:hypothetical protein
LTPVALPPSADSAVIRVVNPQLNAGCTPAARAAGFPTDLTVSLGAPQPSEPPALRLVIAPGVNNGTPSVTQTPDQTCSAGGCSCPPTHPIQHDGPPGAPPPPPGAPPAPPGGPISCCNDHSDCIPWMCAPPVAQAPPAPTCQCPSGWSTGPGGTCCSDDAPQLCADLCGTCACPSGFPVATWWNDDSNNHLNCCTADGSNCIGDRYDGGSYYGNEGWSAPDAQHSVLSCGQATCACPNDHPIRFGTRTCCNSESGSDACVEWSCSGSSPVCQCPARYPTRNGSGQCCSGNSCINWSCNGSYTQPPSNAGCACPSDSPAEIFLSGTRYCCELPATGLECAWCKEWVCGPPPH